MTPDSLEQQLLDAFSLVEPVAGKGYYRLEGHTPVPCGKLSEWGQSFQEQDRAVARTRLGPLYICTSFIAIDHSFGFGEDRRPVLFETMVFGWPGDEPMWRYCTWEEAEAGHAEVEKESLAALRRIARYEALRERTPRNALPKRAPFRRRWVPLEFRV